MAGLERRADEAAVGRRFRSETVRGEGVNEDSAGSLPAAVGTGTSVLIKKLARSRLQLSLIHI